MKPIPSIIDSHVHLEMVRKAHPRRMAWMQDKGITPVSWAFGENIETVRDLRNYLRSQSDFIDRLRDQGWRCGFLAGVHPRNIPAGLKAEEIRDLVLPQLDHPCCLGVGEIGLETGSEKEKENLAAHLDLFHEVEQRNRRFGVHTPRRNKSEILNLTLPILKAHPGIEKITVIDHCTPETLGRVLEAGFRAGVTLSPVKTSPAELRQIVAAHGDALNRIMCNTDSGSEFYEDLYRLAVSDIFPNDVKARLTKGSASDFFSRLETEG